jgi:poly-beta-hydroxyalkanoate depolymerase
VQPDQVSARKVVADLCAETRTDENPMARVVIPGLPPSDHIQHRAELAHMNRHWCWEVGYQPPPKGGLAGILFGRLKARLTRFVWTVLDRHLRAERDFIENLVRFNNELAKRCDQLSDEVRMVAKAEREVADGLVRRVDLAHSLLEARVAQLEAMLQAVSEP